MTSDIEKQTPTIRRRVLTFMHGKAQELADKADTMDCDIKEMGLQTLPGLETVQEHVRAVQHHLRCIERAFGSAIGKDELRWGVSEQKPVFRSESASRSN